MNIKEYHQWVKGDHLNHNHGPDFFAIGASEEIGEILGIIKRKMRGDEKYNDLYSDFVKTKMLKEIGDSLWYIMGLIISYGWTLEEVLTENYEKLTERDKKGNRLGDGSER